MYQLCVRSICCPIAAVVCLIAVCDAFAQPAPKSNPIPFLPPGIGSNSDKFFEQMFGPSNPAEEQKLAAIEVSAKDEHKFGQQLVDAYLASLRQQKLKVVRKGKDVEYLQQLVKTLQPAMTNARRYKEITVYVVETSSVDARSFPAGTLFFSRGLLTFVDNEAALIGVVGHELSHLDRGHQLLPLKRTKILEQQSAGGFASFDPQKFFSEGTMMMRLLGRPFRPEDEAAADRDGAAWAYQAGYDPREMALLFAKLHQKNKDQKVPFGSFFRTHPYNEDRYDAVMKQYDDLQQGNPQEMLYRGKKNLTLRIAKSQQQFPE